MYCKISERLADASEKLGTYRKIQRSLEKARQILSTERSREKELYEVLVAEKKDFDKLERLSLSTVFYTLVGKREEQVDKEKQDYLAAKLKYDEAKEAVRSLEKEIARYKSELELMGDPSAEYQRLLKEKEELLLNAQDQTSARLFDLFNEEVQLFQLCKELKEAVIAGESAARHLQKTSDELQSARGWGAADMLGGGLITTAIKHSKLDNAQHSVQQAQAALGIFQRELADVKEYRNINIEPGSFARFADYFFDGLIADMVIQTRIKSSHASVTERLAEVKRTVWHLKNRLKEVESALENVQSQRRMLVEGAQVRKG
ncbi:MAG: hypothetical protein FH756_01170 [Firmicutes bacterium]|nr:hypothetical protein [Bacillota bacterium]